MGKDRLFEIFSKVNKLSLNEANEEELVNDMYDRIESDLKYDIDNNLFKESIPKRFEVNILDQNIELENIEEGFDLMEVFDDGQHKYKLTYKGTVNNIDFYVIVYVYVDLNPVYTYEKFEFKPKIMVDTNEIDVNFGR